MKYRKRFMTLAISGVLLIGLLAIVLSAPSPVDETTSTETEDRSWIRWPFFGDAPGDPSSQGIASNVLLAHFEEGYRYPPTSGALTADRVDFVRHELVPLVYEPALYVKEGELARSDFACKLQPLQQVVTEGMQARIRLSCGRSAGGREYLKVQLTRLDVESFVMTKTVGDSTYTLPQSQTLLEETKNDQGGWMYDFKFDPGREDWGDMKLDVTFRIPAEAEKRTYRRQAMFFASPQAPARFTGSTGETIEDGSLLLQTRLNVKRAGRYTIFANLKNDEDYVAFATFDGRLEAGRQTIELKFYGKIFHDRGLEGPYTMTGLRGYLHTGVIDDSRLDDEPEKVAAYLREVQARIDSGVVQPNKQFIPTLGEEYRTRSYGLSDFSDKEWQSPEKERRRQLLENLSE